MIAEVALSVALLIGAGLLLRSFAKLQDVELGFKPENLLTMRINLARNRYSGHQESWAFYTRLLRETKALPGVQDAALTSSVPLSGLGNPPVARCRFRAEPSRPTAVSLRPVGGLSVRAIGARSASRCAGAISMNATCRRASP